MAEYKLSYTASQIDAKLGKIDGLAAKSELPTKTSELTNDSDFTTKQYVDDAVANIDIPEVDLTDYALKSEIPTDYLKTIPAEYVTESELAAKKYLTSYTETDPTVPAWAKASTKPSYTKSEVGLGNVDNVKQYSASNPPPYPVTSVNGKTGDVTINIPTVPTTVSAFENDAGYLDEAGVDKVVEGAIASLSQIEAPKIVSSVDEMTDTTKHYVLDGNIWAHRTITTEGETVLVPNFTNLIKFDASGNPTNVALNQRYSGSAGASSGYMSSQDGSFAIKDATARGASSPVFYISQKPVGQAKCATFASDGTTLHSDGVATVNATDFTSGANGEYKGGFTAVTGAPMVKFSVQISTSAITAESMKGLIVTLNEPITYTEQKTEGKIVSEWYDTGISYAPTFKTDLIGVLGENNVVYLSNNLPAGTYTLKNGDSYATIGTITVQ